LLDSYVLIVRLSITKELKKDIAIEPTTITNYYYYYQLIISHYLMYIFIFI